MARGSSRCRTAASGLTASLSYDGGGRLTGATDARLVELAGPAAGPRDIGEADAESLGRRRWARGRVRGPGAGLQAYAAEPPFPGPARPLPFPAGVGECGRNGGLETMADVGRRTPPARVRGAAGRVEHGAGVGRARRRVGRTRLPARVRRRLGGRAVPARPARRGCRTATCCSSSAASRRSARGSSAWRARAWRGPGRSRRARSPASSARSRSTTSRGWRRAAKPPAGRSST